MDARKADHVRRQVVDICHRGLDAIGLAHEFAAALRPALPFQGWCWHTIDPATLILTGAIKPDFEPEPRFASYEYTVPDVNKFAYLAGRRQPAGVLSEATHGFLEQSRRYRDLLQPRGIRHELRASFVADSGCWAACALYRPPDDPDFTTDEAEWLGSISKLIGEGFRRALLVGAVTVAPAVDGPGLVLLDRRGDVQSITPAAERWFRDVVEVGMATEGRLPALLYAVAARARSTMQAEQTLALARALTRSGDWVTLHGMRLEGTVPELTAVIIEPARPAEIAPLIVSAYGLTERERDITQLILRGLSTRQIANRLHLSPLTVQDYLKAVFEKTGVSSRRELVAQIFLDHYQPRLKRGERPVASGYFA